MAQQDLKLVIALARAHSSLFGSIERSLKPRKLTISEFGVLEFLYHKGRHPVQAIADKILVTSGTITYVIDRLTDKGLVLRKQCETDKRKYYVDLTQEGRKLIAEVFPEHEKHLGSLFNTLGDDTKNMLINSLFDMKNAIDKEDIS